MQIYFKKMNWKKMQKVKATYDKEVICRFGTNKSVLIEILLKFTIAKIKSSTN